MCGCRAPYMPGPGRECSPPEIICVRDAMDVYGRNSSQTCLCPVPCHTVRYAATISQAKFPSDFYSQVLAAQLSANPNLNVDADYFSNNLCLINIFFNELIRQTTTQQEAYLFVSLLSDIGGSLGMWMGASILTVVEIFDIMGYSLFRTRAPRSNHMV
ncbi:acid-sensing ion channel 4-A [Strongylocentrotus purpuratus]|uniref:Uncharacterized protein n=1 Tax=Strongylocentrotus purpuratus TaxID=7668 RepID=A0A7M7T015_STRPU|nr:acid-sensing ion channel 4-A [Strongylocentrotus purpuratus]